uniref:Uncharacterized protein n=1 Tax=Arundo donax TaxID=35708 RepID=A0A0A8ZHL5_ARUDO
MENIGNQVTMLRDKAV